MTPEGRAALPLPAPLDAGWEWPFAGRAQVLARLEDRLREPRAARRLVLIGGEPGVGKTRLVSELARRVHADGVAVLLGRSEDGPDRPYRPFEEALGHLLEHGGGRSLSQADVRELARIVPQAAIAAPAFDATEAVAAESQPFQMFGAVAAALERASVDGPLVLVLEDLHWADPGSLRLLRYLMTGPAQGAVAIVATYRPLEVATGSRLAALLADLGSPTGTLRVDLEALSLPDARQLVAELAGRELTEADEEAVATLHHESGGNPLLLTQLLRGLLAEGAIRETEGRWDFVDDLSATPLPATLEELVAGRVARLGDTVAEALEAAAVVGREFDAALVAHALGRDLGETAAALDRAGRVGLIASGDGGTLAFNHPLIRRALQGVLDPARRGALHRRVAEGLELRTPRPDAAVLATHWASAEPPDPAAARRWAAAAGREALDRVNGDAATHWYRSALDQHERVGDGDERVRCELLVGLGAGMRAIGEPGFRETLLDAGRLARRIGDRALLVQAALLSNRGFASRSGAVDEERVAMLEAALDAVGAADGSERAHLLATLAVELTFSGQWERRVKLSDDAVAIARRLGDRRALAHALTLRFIPTWMPQTLGDRLACTEEAVRLADQLGDRWVQFHASHWRFVGLLQSGALGEADGPAERVQELARRLGDPTTRWMSTYDRSTLELVAGRLDRAEELAREALAAAGSGPEDPLPMFNSQLANIRYEQGRLPELQPMIAEVVAQDPGNSAFRSLLALAYVEGELRNEARNLLAAGLKTGFAEVRADPTWLLIHAAYAHVAADLGDRAAAGALYEPLAPWREQVVYAGVGAWGTVNHVLGRLATTLGRFEEAEEHLHAARGHARGAGAPIWLARAQLDLARLLIARDAPGDREAATEPLEEAATLAARTGAAAVERRARSMREHLRAIEVVAGAGHGAQRLRMPLPGGDPPAAAPDAPDAGGTSDRAVLEHLGDYWVMRSGGGEVRLRDGKGVQYLARLLARPGAEIHAADLQRGDAAPAAASVRATAHEELAIRAGGTEDAGEVLDAEAKRRYRARIDELREQIDEAERFNDPERETRAREELEFLARELAAAVGIGGRDRKAASQSERARVNVTRALRSTISRIADHDKGLGAHLEHSVRTGTFCSYVPASGEEIEWDVRSASA